MSPAPGASKSRRRPAILLGIVVEDWLRDTTWLTRAYSALDRLPVPEVKLDIVTGGGADFPSHGLSHDERPGFCLSLTDNFGCERPALAAMQKLMRHFMHQCHELLGLRLAR